MTGGLRIDVVYLGLPIDEPKCGGGRGRGCGASANEYSCAHGAQINLGDLNPYLTCGCCHKIIKRKNGK
jgi:hypothetical protein